MTEHTPSHNRADHIDQLRGLAVVGMILAHALYFFHNGDSVALVGLARILNTTVLTFFVFIAGLAASRWLDTTSHIPTRHLFWPTAKRVGILYVTYVVIVCAQIGSNAVSLSLQQIGEKLFAAITFQSPPSFTEFLPLFMLITLVSLLFRKIYRKSRSSLAITLGISAGLYIIGWTLYALDIPTYLIGIKALVSGHESLLRFPLFFYLPIYIIGVWWQYQSDHNNSASVSRQKLSLISIASIIVFLGISFGKHPYSFILDPLVRWPPSIGFLTSGLLFSMCIFMLQPSLNALPRIKKITGYMGRDALDMLIHHLVLLFFYQAVFGIQFGTVPHVMVAFILLILVTIILSSLAFTNKISFPVHIQTHGTMRVRKRYIALIMLMIIFIAWNLQLPKTVSPYGNVFKKNSAATKVLLPKTSAIYISTNRTWYTHDVPKTNQIELSAQVIDTATNETITISPNTLTVYGGNEVLPISGIAQNNNVVVFIISTKQLPIGTHELSVRITQHTQLPITSNTIKVHVTEPLLVAWSLDWEGWEPAQKALPHIEELGTAYAPIPFTHFVHPRTFMPNIMSVEQQMEIQTFLKKRQMLGDEIALHMHMQFDFVAAAGVTPRRTNAWGLRSIEGYDIPTTEYSPNEFRTILNFAQDQLSNVGFTNIQGFRAGGWYIDAQQLDIVKNAGFAYDSSGRSKPTSGAFQNTPWNLPVDAQPYTLDTSDQNKATTSEGLLEIPNNALTTYELSSTELIALAKNAYTGTPLAHPKTLIYVSHPQFYEREFGKIPPVLDYLHSVSLERDNGPIVFSTMSNIANVWKAPRF